MIQFYDVYDSGSGFYGAGSGFSGITIQSPDLRDFMVQDLGLSVFTIYGPDFPVLNSVIQMVQDPRIPVFTM